MTFLTPTRLFLLIAVAALAVAYVYSQRQRKTYAIRFSAADLFDDIAPERPGLRRHLPAGLLLCSLALLVAAYAQPARRVEVPRERATVIVAIDVSLSMQADDITPSRIEAAKTAASQFVDELPPTLNVGVVAFAGTASVLVSPTTDREAAKATIETLELSERTAVGEAIFTSLEALKRVPGDGTTDPPPAVIVVLSDGATTAGRSDLLASQTALQAGVPVSTISFGTPFGTIIYDDPATPRIENQPLGVPVEERSLRLIAENTNGTFFSAASLEELNSVYDNIGSAIGFETKEREITDWFAGAAFLTLLATAGLNLLWFQRIP